MTAFLGRFHPLLVHFPIALLVAGGGLAAWCAVRARRGIATPLRSAVSPLLWLGALSAVAAATTGYLLGSGGGYGGLVYERHETLGIVVAVSAVLTAAAWSVATSRPSRATRALSALLLGHTLFALTGAGHLGATITHGEGYLTERAPAPLRRALSAAGLAPAEPPRGSAEDAVAYDALVQPILSARCADCHGAREAMGGLRLDSSEGLRKGGEHGPVLAPGRAASSELLRRASLPPSAPHAMPPRGRRAVTAGEGAVLRWWIDSGAPFDKRLADLELPPELRAVVEASLGPLSTGGPSLPRVSVAPVDARALASLAARRLSARPVADGSPFLDVRVDGARDAFGDADLASLRPLAPNVVWLNLAGSAVTDGGLASVAALPHLTRLDLARTRVASLAPLASLAELEVLNLRGTRVTDAGLEPLSALKKLRRVYVWQTGVTASGVERLRASLPRIVVDTGDLPAPPGDAHAAPAGAR